MNKMNMS